MKLSIKTTFDFGKLRNEFPRILEKHTQRTARSSAEGARENISKGLSPPLKESTLEIRKHRKTGGSKPLFETGSLFSSIKGTSKGLRMNRYGLYHHEGFTPKKIPYLLGDVKTKKDFLAFAHNKSNIKVPARPFIFPSEKTILKSFDAFRKELRRALKK
tara:strand:- start:1498 stop:1974 length:477 start_codon:yes stop_codon:yes gene_type:complete